MIDAATATGPGTTRHQVEQLFAAAREETLETGRESDFSRELAALVREEGPAAVAAIEAVVLDPDVDAEVAGEALLWLGHLADPPSHAPRRQLLERCLFSPSSHLRDAAGLGLAFMDDRSAVPALRAAVEREPNPELRNDLRQALEQLESAAPCR